MTRDEALGMLAALARGRGRWLEGTVSGLRAEAVWLVGSLAAGRDDEWSDLDIIVVGGDGALDGALLTLDLPQNGPAGGGYVGAMYDVGHLPLWVDWYHWPPGVPIPAGAALLAGTGRAGNLDLSATLDLIGRGEPGPAPDADVFTLAMLPLAAKYIARRDVEKATAMASMLDSQPNVAALSAVLAQIKGHQEAAALVHRYLELVESGSPDSLRVRRKAVQTDRGDEEEDAAQDRIAADGGE